MDNTQVLLGTPLFRGIEKAELPQVLHCLHAQTRRYQKGAFILLAGDAPGHIGIVLDGRAQVLREDANGARNIVTELETGEMFAETFAFAWVPALPVSVQATGPCNVLLVDAARLVAAPTNACPFGQTLVRNMLAVLAGKALALNRKLAHLEKRTTREKLLSYLMEQAALQHSASFTIPFNRQQLADYLLVERSALSAELSRMQKEGLLRYHRNAFQLPNAPHQPEE